MGRRLTTAAVLVALVLPLLATTPAAADEADRRDARRILARDEYQPNEPPRPFRGVLQWLGDRLAPLGRALARLFDDPRVAVAGLVAAVALSAVVTAALVRRRDRTAVERRRPPAAAVPADPDALEREADERERAGDLETALRRRFLAGLLRLDRAGLLAYRADATSGSVGRTLASPTFDGLAGAFDEVVYGGRRAAAGDLDAARRGWPRVLEEAVR
jgi:hypothetical protein